MLDIEYVRDVRQSHTGIFTRCLFSFEPLRWQRGGVVVFSV